MKEKTWSSGRQKAGDRGVFDRGIGQGGDRAESGLAFMCTAACVSCHELMASCALGM